MLGVFLLHNRQILEVDTKITSEGARYAPNFTVTLPALIFRRVLRELINFDITEQNDLVKRSGAVESPVFAGFVDKKVIYGTERVVENIEGTDPQGTHTVAQRNVNIITNLPFLLLGQVFHEGLLLTVEERISTNPHHL